MPTPSPDFASILARLARSTVIEDGKLGDVLRAITEASAAALGVDRVNVWLFDRERTRLRCIEGYERGANRHTAGDEILAATAPAYFEALGRLRTVAAFDALQDPQTRQLGDYLRARGITTLLDAPLYLGGAVGGVVCHEHVGPPRQWNAEERAFASSVGDLVSLAMEADRRIRAERSLREGEELFRAVGDRLHDAMLLVDVEGPSVLTVRYANEAACRLSGYSPEDLTGQPLALLADPGAQGVVDAQLARALAGEIVLFDGLQRRKDGSVMPVEVYGRLIDCAGRPLLLLLGRDISQRVRAEQAQREFQAKVLEAQRRESLGILAAGIAHEFSNLMMAVHGGTSLALASLPESHPARTRLLKVEEAARRATDLCRQLRAYSGQARFVMMPVDLSSLVSELLNLMRAAISRHVTVSRQLASGLPAVEADADQVRLVVIGLVTNAIEAIGEKDPGSISVSTRAGRFTQADFDDAERGHAPAGDYVCLEIEDNGRGMSDETRRRMMEPFFTTKVTGRGLGLAAVHAIVRAHRGALAVTSQLGRGTRVRVFFPVATVSSIRDAAPDRPLPGDAPPTILVVDDEPLVREVATVTLEGEGFAVVAARDGREARHLILTRSDIAAVVLDLSLPDTGADEMAAMIRQHRPRLPVILSSGHHEPIAISGLALDEAAYLQKPWQPSRLVAVVRHALARSSGSPPP